jgi:anti-sigma factor RsiW
MSAEERGPDLDRLDDGERRELISAYLDGELSADLALGVSVWLDEHPEALREVEHLRHLWDVIEVYEDEPVPEGFAPGVLSAVGIEHEEHGAGTVLSMARFRRVLSTAAAMLVAVGATVFVMSERNAAMRAESPPAAHLSTLDSVPVEYLEDIDLLVGLDDETFNAFLDSEEVDESIRGS